jgi:hypothetical protein
MLGSCLTKSKSQLAQLKFARRWSELLLLVLVLLRLVPSLASFASIPRIVALITLILSMECVPLQETTIVLEEVNLLVVVVTVLMTDFVASLSCNLALVKPDVLVNRLAILF